MTNGTLHDDGYENCHEINESLLLKILTGMYQNILFKFILVIKCNDNYKDYTEKNEP
jgi:hypothetical protein